MHTHKLKILLCTRKLFSTTWPRVDQWNLLLKNILVFTWEEEARKEEVGIQCQSLFEILTSFPPDIKEALLFFPFYKYGH